MSRFFSSRFSTLTPYVPGEQPRDMQYVKLNTNESPFPPSAKAQEYARKEADALMLYPDPDYNALREKLAEVYHVAKNEVIVGNGSDEILDFAFAAFCENGAVFPDTSYGFYPVFAQLNAIDYTEIPVNDATLAIDPADYCGVNKTIFIANPNAPSGIALSLADIEMILKSNPNNVVVVDEAYVDFGAESAIPLVRKYDNLLVVQTFSKSRSFAGARFGFGIASSGLISDMNTIRCSTNPYNVSRMTAAAAVGALEDEAYTKENCARIIETRGIVVKKLRELGFIVLDSSANFIFARHPDIGGKDLYLTLKKRGVLVRHFDKPKIAAYNRITIGSPAQMDRLISEIEHILNEVHA
ncbi:MAG TPA: histidinol-phosphate transaminase [Methanocorpusculum sp.]|nr:histidinol-phosphate transaminase [Methanocorpusculum sp.]